MKISVFGSGAWGTAVAMLLDDNGHEVTLWSAFKEEADVIRTTRENPYLKGVIIPESILVTSDMDQASREMEFAVIATPSFAVRGTLKKLKDRVPEGCLFLCVSKGIEKGTAKRFSEIFEEILGEEALIASLSGPSHAEEVSRKIPTACVVASKYRDVAYTVQELFTTDYFRVYTSDDMVGVELGAAMKNIIALCAGVCDGLGYGDNTIAMLMTRGLAEVADLCVALGGRKETLAGLAGMGDLIVTCTSVHSRNRRAGVLIGKGMSAEEAMEEVGAVVEGYYATEAAHTLAEKTGVEMPISKQAYLVLYENKNAEEAIKDLMKRELRPEFEENTGSAYWVR